MGDGEEGVGNKQAEIGRIKESQRNAGPERDRYRKRNEERKIRSRDRHMEGTSETGKIRLRERDGERQRDEGG